jgi:hypothetical protein
MGIPKILAFNRSYESDTTVGVVRPQPLPGRQASPFSIPIAIGREGYNEFFGMPSFYNQITLKFYNYEDEKPI